MTRLRLELAEFSFAVEHIRGKTFVVAYALSRIHVDDIRSTARRDEDLNNLNVLITTRSMKRKQNMAAKQNIESSEKMESAEKINELKISHAISRHELKGIPIIHTHLAKNTRSPNFFIIIVYDKYRSSNELRNFTIRFVEETVDFAATTIG